MPIEPVSVQAVIDLVIATILGRGGRLPAAVHAEAGRELRTHGLVALGSCAFATYSALLGDTRIVAG